MPAINPLTEVANVMQVVMDDDSKVPLSYASTDENGDTVWTGSVTLPSNISAATHNYTIESSASGMVTDVTTHFATPATGSDNTGLVTTGGAFVVSNPVPAITAISPNSNTAGESQFTLTVTGTNFVSNSVVKWNNVALATTYVSATELTAIVPAVNVVSVGTPAVTIFNPTPGGGTSSAQTFTVSSAPPSSSGSGGGGGSAKKKTTPIPSTPTIIPGCDNRTTGFSVLTGQSCIGNIVTNMNSSLYNFGTTTLRLGSNGEAVKELQRFLNAKLNLGLILDGKLGLKTIAVIKKWQKDHGLVADGLVGPQTKAKMRGEV
jgi:hypothetical protein